MARQYCIRQATGHDLDTLFNLEQVAFDSDRFTRDQIDYLLTESRATTFVLEDRSTIIGAACVLWRKSNRAARLYNMAIHPKYQLRSQAKKLLEECELEAARRYREKMTLEVHEDNHKAIRFYEKKGYLFKRSMPNYYNDGAAGLKYYKELHPITTRKLKLKVPYYAQTLDFTCGPACLMMALRYFDPKVGLTRALEMTLWKEATLIFEASGFGGTDGYGLALSALSRGLNCRMVMSMDATPLLKSVRIVKKREVMRIVHADLRRKARKAGLGSAFYEYGIEEIVSALHHGMLPIVMISTYRLTGDRVPHWVIVTGFDEDNIYIHDPDVASYRRDRTRAHNLRIDKSEFLRMSRYGKEVYRCLVLVGPSPSRSQRAT